MHPYADRLRKRDWYVGDCDIDRARRMVVLHHYACGTSNTGVSTHGLYRVSDDRLSGISWWLPPILESAKSVWPEDPHAVLSLSRLVIAPGVPKNAAVFLLARSVRLLGSRWRCLVTYADTWKGHTGEIYRIAGWEDLGLTKPEPVYTIDGRSVSRKAGPKTRTHAEMLRLGAVFEGKWPRHKFRLVRRGRIPSRPASAIQRDLFA
jgi:hypothetical protein